MPQGCPNQWACKCPGLLHSLLLLSLRMAMGPPFTHRYNKVNGAHQGIAGELEKATSEFKEFERKDIKYRWAKGGGGVGGVHIMGAGLPLGKAGRQTREQQLLSLACLPLHTPALWRPHWPPPSALPCSLRALADSDSSHVQPPSLQGGPEAHEGQAEEAGGQGGQGRRQGR